MEHSKAVAKDIDSRLRIMRDEKARLERARSALLGGANGTGATGTSRRRGQRTNRSSRAGAE